MGASGSKETCTEPDCMLCRQRCASCTTCQYCQTQHGAATLWAPCDCCCDKAYMVVDNHSVHLDHSDLPSKGVDQSKLDINGQDGETSEFGSPSPSLGAEHPGDYDMCEGLDFSDKTGINRNIKEVLIDQTEGMEQLNKTNQPKFDYQAQERHHPGNLQRPTAIDNSNEHIKLAESDHLDRQTDLDTSHGIAQFPHTGRHDHDEVKTPKHIGDLHPCLCPCNHPADTTTIQKAGAISVGAALGAVSLPITASAAGLAALVLAGAILGQQVTSNFVKFREADNREFVEKES